MAGTALLLLIAALGVAGMAGLRAMGVDGTHPWIRQLATRPWRDGQDVLRLALRHMSEVFVVGPSGSLLAPNFVELRLSPRDFGSLGELMDIGLVRSSAAEAYQHEVAAQGARFASAGPGRVNVTSDPSVPEGRWSLRPVRPVRAGGPMYSGEPVHLGEPVRPRGPAGTAQPVPPMWPSPGDHAVPGHDGRTRAGAASAAGGGAVPAADPGWPAAGPWPAPDSWPAADSWPAPDSVWPAASPDLPEGWGVPGGGGPPRAAAMPGGEGPPRAVAGPDVAGAPTVTGLPTVTERARLVIPPLKLVTGDRVAQTRTSGAYAGRGAVDLVLPEVPTVSREHARFTFSDGQWWVANLGRNGLTLNDVPLAGEHPVRDGDSIRWGRNPDALLSRVEIG